MSSDRKTKVSRIARRMILGCVIIGALSALGSFGAIEYTARPQFCRTCHIMEPYYVSWENSSHGHIACTDCHFEPGLLETLEGKFKASTHLAKYVTGTQGTKPWAEVDDRSCMRAGCHSKRLLEGPIAFKGTLFDHRPHLKEMRRGKKLRCTTCHSQIVQGEHMTVTKSTCFICHFSTVGDTKPVSDCMTCHGPPSDDIQVGEILFNHSPYLERGVACLECHNQVTEGTGTVRREKCHSCHDEVAHIDRIGETEEMHTIHVSDHKVECFDCHDEVYHGLLPRRDIEVEGECKKCHKSFHNPQTLLYRGRDGLGGKSLPDPMYQTHVSCDGCHRFTKEGEAPNPFTPRPAPASEVSCMHCHGPAFGSMVDHWKEDVQAALGKLSQGRKRVRAGLGKGQPLLDAQRDAFYKAERNLDLIKADGSHGVHNIRFTWRLLREASTAIKEAAGRLGEKGADSRYDVGPPLKSKHRCAETCHIDVARRPVPYGTSQFHHGRHASKTGDCETCHDIGRHGSTRFNSRDCLKCHHTEKVAEKNCGSCHGGVLRFTSGENRLGERIDSDMSTDDLECTDCHVAGSMGTAKGLDAIRETCVDCHDEEYGPMLDGWRSELATLTAALENALASGRLDDVRKKRAQDALAALRRGGGIHNMPLARRLLTGK